MIRFILKLTITLLLLVSSILVNAQNFQGKAFYQTKRNLDIKLDSTKIDNSMQKQFQEMLRKQFEKTYILTFNKAISVYKQEEKLDKPNPAQGGIIIESMGGSNILFKDIKNKTYISAQEIYGKKFLINDSLNLINWNIEKETKMIGKYLCIKATYIKLIDDYDAEMKKKEKQKKSLITAWYTPEIPISNGPHYYGGLPGLILELHEDKMHYVCTKIVLNPSEKIVIVAPKKGKEINQKDFEKIMKKKSEEMMERYKSRRKKGNDGNSISIEIRG